LRSGCASFPGAFSGVNVAGAATGAVAGALSVLAAATAGFVITPPRVFSNNEVADMEYVDPTCPINDLVMA
jgi:hypothetical protein